MPRRAPHVTQKEAVGRFSSPQRGQRTVLPYNAVLRMTTIVRDWSDLRAEESMPCDGVLVWSVTLDAAAAESVLSEGEIDRVGRYRFDVGRRLFALCLWALGTN